MRVVVCLLVLLYEVATAQYQVATANTDQTAVTNNCARYVCVRWLTIIKYQDRNQHNQNKAASDALTTESVQSSSLGGGFDYSNKLRGESLGFGGGYNSFPSRQLTSRLSAFSAGGESVGGLRFSTPAILPTQTSINSIITAILSPGRTQVEQLAQYRGRQEESQYSRASGVTENGSSIGQSKSGLIAEESDSTSDAARMVVKDKIGKYKKSGRRIYGKTCGIIRCLNEVNQATTGHTQDQTQATNQAVENQAKGVQNSYAFQDVVPVSQNLDSQEQGSNQLITGLLSVDQLSTFSPLNVGGDALFAAKSLLGWNKGM